MAKNKGYTLVELIIVIGIMMILSGLSYVTLGIIKTAKRSAAANTLDNQISNCLIRTKAISDPGDTANPLCMVIQKRTDGAYAIMIGYNNGTTVVDSSGAELDPDDNDDCEAVLSKEIGRIAYTSSETSQECPFLTEDKMIIQFIKAYGSLQYGAGEYELYDRSNELYVTIDLDKVSGNHCIK